MPSLLLAAPALSEDLIDFLDHEPPCTCQRIDVDLYDARGCELCNSASEWNFTRNRILAGLPVANVEPVYPAWAAEDDDAPF